MVDDAKLLEENIRRMNNLDKLLSNNLEGIDASAVASILPPSSKYSQLTVYNLQEKLGRFWVSIIFPYVPNLTLQTKNSTEPQKDCSNFGDMLKNLGMLPLDARMESSKNLGGLEISGIFNLEDGKTVSVKEVSNEGYVSTVVEGLDLNENEQRSQKLVLVNGCMEDGFILESRLANDSVKLGKDAGISLISKPAQKTYTVVNNSLGKEFVNVKLSDYFSALDTCLTAITKPHKITSIKAYYNGNQIDFIGLLKDMRSWYFNQLR